MFSRLAYEDPRWPSPLNRIPRAPRALYFLGQFGLELPRIAIVGTRAADEVALEFTHDLAHELGSLGVMIVSGGARGIDAAAHRGALRAGARTACVLPTGIETPYPRNHESLFNDVLGAGGALVSEHIREPFAAPSSFLRRNAILAGLADAVIVVQAPFRSGALSTAAWAKKLSITVFAVPAAPWDERGRGCLALLRAGARICTSARDVLSVSPFEGRLSVVRRRRHRRVNPQNAPEFQSLSSTARAVWRALGVYGRTADEVSNDIGIITEKVQSAMTELALGGWIMECGLPGLFRRKDSPRPFNALLPETR